MMHQHTPFHDFEEFETAPSGGGRARWVVGLIVFVPVLMAAAAVGYSLGRGTWTIPNSVSGHVPAALAGWLPHGGSGTAAPAKLKDYVFELVAHQAKQGEAVLTVHLKHAPAGKPVPNALVFARRLDMSPAGMPTMTAELEPEAAAEPGFYRFRTNLTMAGDWQLSLAAKVQGETGTVQNQLALKVVP